MTTQYWLVKQEPEKYSWQDLVRDRRTTCDGVRNYQARNNLQAMRPGDRVLFYASVSLKEVQGIATVAKPAFPDPTTDDERWVAVELEAQMALPDPVGLEQIKAGMAWHYKYYQSEQTPEDRAFYADAEIQARASRRGLWTDASPIPPWDFRNRR